MEILRGQRLLNQLEQLEEDSSYTDLYRGITTAFPNTQRRHNATGPVQIVRLEYVPFTGSNNLRIDGQARSGGNTYNPHIMFREVEFQEEDLPTNATIKAVDNQEYHIAPINLANVNVRVKCDCLDFYWRFAAWNSRDDSLIGNPPPPYTPTGNRPPVNPTQTPGVCKHLIKLIQELRTARVVT